MATEAASPVAAPTGVKFSRYRSVRKAAVAKTESAAPPPPVPPLPTASGLTSPQNEGIARSMSRYKRNRVSAASPPPPPPPLPMSAAAVSATVAQQQTSPLRGDNPFKTPPRTAHGRTGGRQSPRGNGELSKQSTNDAVDPFEGSPKSSLQAKAAATNGVSESGQPLTSEDRKERRIRRYEEKRRAEQLANQSEQDRAPGGAAEPLSEGLTTQPALSIPSSPAKEEKKRDRSLLNRLSHRQINPNKTSSGTYNTEAEPSPSAPIQRSPRKSDKMEDLRRQESRTVGIEPGGGGIVPGTDAPVSAVNAGERRVTIRYFEKTINLPVTPETTPSDLIRSAANILTDNIDSEKMVLLESYNKVGLERPIRKYEHIRDVMNSWDRDSVNHLILIPAADDSHVEDLEVSSVSREQPTDISVLINYSQVPGKWKKQWVTLRSDGQMLVCKKEGAKDVSNVCHLSDFDVYRPTKVQLKKVIKPGKKHCFAVKSQEKSTMFMTASTFVHFFATDDRRLATQWYKAIQSWRSWYLVNALGAGQKATKARVEPARAAQAQTHNRGQPSVDSIPYQIGSFKPLLAAEDFLKTLETPQEQQEPVVAARRHAEPPSQRQSIPQQQDSPPLSSFPQTSLPRKLTKQHDSSKTRPVRTTQRNIVQAEPRQSREDTTFAPTSLLGRTYTQRQAASRTRDEPSNDGPFVPGSTLLGTGSPPSDTPTSSHLTRGKSIRSPQESSSGFQSHGSRRQKPEPLLNFEEPENWEPPQHRNKGRGFNPDGSVRLVEAATTPATAIQIPPSTQWRRAPTGPGQQAAPSRYKSSRGRKPDPGPFADPEEEPAFTGLLAKTGRSQGGIETGRGVRTGNRRAGQPMLDMTEANRFAPGSLLASVAVGDDGGPIIDREKRHEKSVGVGEGT